jgi:aldehyde dehydrogenase (NAD+)
MGQNAGQRTCQIHLPHRAAHAGKGKHFAVIETMDGGKAIRESRDIDIPLAAAHFFYYAGWADKIPYAFPGKQTSPLGVAGQVIPWNFPLAHGLVETRSRAGLRQHRGAEARRDHTAHRAALAEIIQEADLPEGVVNIVTGAGATGAAVVNHPDVNKVAFTGSTNVGKLIQRSTAGSGKKLTLELGGKAANIIFADATIDQAVEGIVNGIYFNQGHVCCAGSRLYVEEAVYDEVVRKLKHRMKSLVVGDPLDKNTDIGAINSKEQLGTINKYIKIGQEEGSDMYQPTCDLPGKGFWCRPTLFTQRGPKRAHRTRRDLRPGPRRANLPHHGRSAAKSQQHPLRPQRRRVDGQRQQDLQHDHQAPRRRHLGQHLQQVRSDFTFRRV